MPAGSSWPRSGSRSRPTVAEPRRAGATAGLARGRAAGRRRRRSRARCRDRDELPAGRHPAARLPHPVGDRRARRRDGLAAVADLAPFGRHARPMTGPPAAVPARATPPLERRQADLRGSPAETWDVVIVGGGIVGAGALLDAVSRGLRAALVEQDDFAAGTSSRSSRLIHGGLRYLEQFRFGLVREALDERSRLLSARPAPGPDRAAAVPDLRHPVRVQGLLRRRADPVRHPRRAPRRRLASTAVARRRRSTWRRRSATRGCAAGWSITDGVEDDARFTLAVARTAMADGGVAVTRVRATGSAAGPRHPGRSRRSRPRTS